MSTRQGVDKEIKLLRGFRTNQAGGGNSNSKIFFPPSKGWIFSGYGAQTITDTTLSVTNIYVNQEGNFSRQIAPSSKNRTFSVTFTSTGYMDFYVMVNGTSTNLYQGAPTTTTKQFTVPAGASLITFIWHNSWDSANYHAKTILEVKEVS